MQATQYEKNIQPSLPSKVFPTAAPAVAPVSGGNPLDSIINAGGVNLNNPTQSGSQASQAVLLQLLQKIKEADAARGRVSTEAADVTKIQNEANAPKGLLEKILAPILMVGRNLPGAAGTLFSGAEYGVRQIPGLNKPDYDNPFFAMDLRRKLGKEMGDVDTAQTESEIAEKSLQNMRETSPVLQQLIESPAEFEQKTKNMQYIESLKTQADIGTKHNAFMTVMNKMEYGVQPDKEELAAAGVKTQQDLEALSSWANYNKEGRDIVRQADKLRLLNEQTTQKQLAEEDYDKLARIIPAIPSLIKSSPELAEKFNKQYPGLSIPTDPEKQKDYLQKLQEGLLDPDQIKKRIADTDASLNALYTAPFATRPYIWSSLIQSAYMYESYDPLAADAWRTKAQMLENDPEYKKELDAIKTANPELYKKIQLMKEVQADPKKLGTAITSPEWTADTTLVQDGTPEKAAQKIEQKVSYISNHPEMQRLKQDLAVMAGSQQLSDEAVKKIEDKIRNTVTNNPDIVDIDYATRMIVENIRGQMKSKGGK